MPQLALRFPELRGRQVVVIGAGASGRAAARLAARQGASVVLNDRRGLEEMAEVVAEANHLGFTVEAGGHPVRLLQGADLLVVSPGVPPDNSLVVAARTAGLPIWGEIELAARFCVGRVIGITGSNGKSTVTALAGHILRSAGVAGGTGGNLDTPFADLLDDDGSEAVHVVELSSFQLETVEALRPDVAAILNLSEDHLDRYPSFEAYGEAKARLLEVQSSDGDAILNADDPQSEPFFERVRGRLHRVSTLGSTERGAFLRDGTLVLRTDHGEETLLDRADLSIAGPHNVSNALFAALACRLIGTSIDAIRQGLRTFRALPHRLERIRAVGGITFYDDSKATNPASTARALAAFPDRSVHLILGGRDKGADWESLRPTLRKHACRILLVGEAATSLEVIFADLDPVNCGTVGEAVREGYRRARDGETVLLSPACASFDQYPGFAARGIDFQRAVAGLDRTDPEAPDA